MVVNFLPLVETVSNTLHASSTRSHGLPVHFRRVSAQIVIPPESYNVQDSFVIYIFSCS